MGGGSFCWKAGAQWLSNDDIGMKEKFMNNLLIPIGSFILGGFATKYVEFFFKSVNLRLDKLEEAYKLSSKINTYCNQLSLFVYLYNYCETNKLSKDSLSGIKMIESPLPDLNFLLNFHLKAPKEIISQFEEFEKIVLYNAMPIASIIPGDQKIKKPQSDINETLQLLSFTGKNLQDSLQKWMLNEKEMTVSKVDFIELTKSGYIKIKSWFARYLTNNLSE
jgi:hypothetical protein